MTTGSRGYDCLVSLDSDQVQGRLLAGQIEHRIILWSCFTSQSGYQCSSMSKLRIHIANPPDQRDAFAVDRDKHRLRIQPVVQ